MEICYIFANNPTCTKHFLGNNDEKIQKWLQKHHGCELSLGWKDDHLDNLWETGYTVDDLKI
jgi:hypothetical protein